MLQRKANVPIKPLPDIPGPGGAPRATNQDAAYFAWQEFIALNWPNVPVSGKANTSNDPGAREVADATRQFGQPPLASSANYPALVWESTRHREEIYTGTTVPPSGYVNNPKASWGYHASPGYVYPGLTIRPSATPPDGTAILPGLTPFVNLDEGSQIGTCQMFSGAPYASEDPGNFVFFMAKANFMEYGYSASRGWYNSSLLKNPPNPGSPTNPVATFANTSAYIVINGMQPAPGALDGSKNPGSYVSFPTGTIEFKAAFRVATDAERKAYAGGQPIPGGYHAAPIRYYIQLKDGSYQYVDTVGVLLSLHIIQKTPSAPYFIFATFEHTTNVVGPDGNPVEDADGNLNPNAFTSTPPAAPPTGYVYPSAGTPPAGQYLIPATSPNVFEKTSQSLLGASGVTTQSFIPAPGSNAGAASTKQSYYQNTRDGSTSTLPAANSPSEAQSYITVNRRRFSIPTQPIVQVNKDIHSLIAQYGYNNTNNVWLNYKLVNVQWVPAGNAGQKSPGKLYGDPSGPRPSIAVESFYLSNSLVETNMILSAFSGKFANAGDGLSITDFYDATTTYTNNNTGKSTTKNVGIPFYNVYGKGGPYNMGGCMGCHGNTTVNGGSDASFILGHGRPFQIEGVDPPAAVMHLRHENYFK
jgi:hypothetical protein